MGYEIVQGPFMLLETVAMIYKYVNGISFQSAISRQRFFMNSSVYAAQSKKMAKLQQVMEEVCAGLDVENPRIRHYFVHAGSDPENICLAQLMTHPFCTLREPDLRKNAEEICVLWQELKRRGYWLVSEGEGSMTFRFTNEPGCPGDLFMQIKALHFPGDFLMEMYEVFRDFECSMMELVDLIEPLSHHLQEIFCRESRLFQEAESYWDNIFQTRSLESFVATFADERFMRKMNDRTLVAVMLMDSNLLTAEAAQSPLALGYNMLYIGCAIPAEGRPRSRGGDLESVGNMLKCIGDKKRLEILQRLNKEPSYGLELADIMGVDSGHMSRMLAQMHGYGFLREDKDRLRVYYRTDPEVIHNFLKLVESTILQR